MGRRWLTEWVEDVRFVVAKFGNDPGADAVLNRLRKNEELRPFLKVSDCK